MAEWVWFFCNLVSTMPPMIVSAWKTGSYSMHIPCTHLGVHQLNSLVDDSHEREKLYILSIPWVEEWVEEWEDETPRANSFVAI